MNELHSQLIRAQELLEELKKSLHTDCTSNVVSLRSKNLSQEIVLKIRRLLDQLINQVFLSHNISILGKQNNYKLYFPIYADLESFNTWLKRYLFIQNNVFHRKVIYYLTNYQPFNDNDWLLKLNKLSNESHINLTSHKLHSEKRIRISDKKSSVEFNPDNVFFGEGVEILGQRIDPSTKLPSNNNSLSLEKFISCSFMVENLDLNILEFIGLIILKTQSLLNDFSELMYNNS